MSKYSPTDNHPMCGVSWHDSIAYALWAGKRLPTEAEWERAARGGLEGQPFPWGDDRRIKGIFAHMNVSNAGTIPVGSFIPNGYGLYDMAGNV